MTNHSEQLNKLAAALAKAQAKIRNAEEDKSNPHYKSKYATLTSLWECCRTPLSENGLSVTQTFDESGSRLLVVTTLMHSSGQWIRSSFPITQSLKIQETGSAITYARRYSLSSIVGIAPGDNDDDDGEKDLKSEKEKPESDYVKPLYKQPVKPEEPPAPETATRTDVEKLLELVKQTPEERQLNFYKVLGDKGWSDPYKMSAKFCSFQISSAQLMVAKAKQEVSNEA